MQKQETKKSIKDAEASDSGGFGAQNRKEPMIIDFHTHTFPEKIAAGAIDKLSHTSHSRALTDGTENGLLAHMRMSGVTHSVILPVATAARQVPRINDASARLNEARRGEGLISFASMHPELANVREELVRVRDLGFRGIKIHPVYQGADLDSPAFLRILEVCAELGLVVVTHAGLDIGFPGIVHAAPSMALRALRALKGGPVSRTREGEDIPPEKEREAAMEGCLRTAAKALSGIGCSPSRTLADDGGFRLVLAHMGGWRNWEEVAILAQSLCEAGPVMIDTAFSAGAFPPLDDGYWKEEETKMLGKRAFVSIIRAFGAHRVLFGSDAPWGSQKETLDFLEGTELTDIEKALVLWKNAGQLLGNRVREG